MGHRHNIHCTYARKLKLFYLTYLYDKLWIE